MRRSQVDDFGRHRGERVERVTSLRFLGADISNDLTWTIHITAQVKKTQQWLFILRTLKKARLPQENVLPLPLNALAVGPPVSVALFQ